MDTSTELNPADELAKIVAQHMRAADAMAQNLAVEFISHTEGACTVAIEVHPHLLNSHGTAHGGLLFTLADIAFAYACNSRNQMTVAAACQIDFIRPAQAGDRLTATAKELVKSGKSGLYDVTIHNQHGALVAVFRGKSHQIPGQLVPDQASPAPESR